MNAKKLILLVGAAAALGALAFWSKRESASREAEVSAGLPALPQLDNPDILNRIATIELITPASTVRLARVEGRWVAPDRFNYPLRFDNVRNFLIQLAGLKASQPVSLPEGQWGKLNLLTPRDAVDSAQAGLLLELKDEQGVIVTELVVGKERMAARTDDQPYGGVPSGRYIRIGGRVFLVAETFMDVPGDSLTWVDRQVVNVPAADVVSIKVEQPGEAVIELARPEAGGDFVLAGLKKNEETDVTRANNLADTLSWLQFSDVADPALTDEETGMDRPIRFEARTRDGLVYTLKVGKTCEGSSDRYARVSVTYQAPGEDAENADAKQKAENAEASVSMWLYRFPAFKLNGLTGGRENLLKKPGENSVEKPEAASTVPLPVMEE